MKARAELQQRAARAFTEAEWAAVRDRLLKFISLLREWDRKPELLAKTASRRGNVSLLCQQEI